MSELSRDFNHEDSISSGFEPETPTSVFSHRILAGDSQDELFEDNSGQFGTRINNTTINTNQDEIPLIEPHQSSNPRCVRSFSFMSSSILKKNHPPFSQNFHSIYSCQWG